jgi:PKD repeat protein
MVNYTTLVALKIMKLSIMKNLLALTTLFFLVLNSFGQNTENWCGFDPIIEKKISENPNYLNEISQKIQDIRQQAAENPSPKAAIYTIPVVFHVIHDGGPSNISMAQIESGVEVMNEDFAALNTDASNIRNTTDAPFSPVYADVQVEFKLAKIDPNGNCTNGIQRKFAPNLIDNAGENVKSSANGGLDAWPNDSYMNIWVVNSIESSGQGTTLGYAFLPYSGWSSGHGILNRHDRIGRVGTAMSFGGRTLTHEMGHICGLLHTFQEGCHSNDCSQNGDYICDTPPVEQLFGCLSTSNTCANVPTNDYYGFDALDMNENHMAYSSCRVMFTEDQKNLMQNNFQTISNFISLTSPANLTATGVNQPDVVCKSEFSSNKQVICSGQSIDFTDMSYHGQTTWSWTFTGGMPGTSTDQNPTILYSTPGTYEVTLEISDGTNNATETKTSYIKVLNNSVALPFYEDFEALNSLPSNFWIIENLGSNAAFEIGNVGLSGTKSAMLQNFGQPQGGLDDLISSPIDLSSITDEVTLTFRYAYRKRNSTNDEWLRVFISNNCGDTWVQRKTLKGDALGEQVVTTSWEPSSDNDWVTVHMTNITGSYWVEDFRLRFQFENDNGNNFYIDDINIYQGAPSDEVVLGISDENSVSGLQVFPNPADEELNIKLNLEKSQGLTFSLMNVQGQEVLNRFIAGQNGQNLVVLGTQNISEGVYFLNILSSDGTKNVRKIVLK